MEERLMEAAHAGDTSALYACIRQDPNVFRRFDETEFIDTPLHIAAGRGYTDFAMAIMYLRPSFARKLNPDVFSPIHLALLNQHTETVGLLLAVDKDLARIKGKKGYTALHCVAESGTLDVLAHILTRCPESIKDFTIQGETALHIAAQNNRFEALEILARWIQRSRLYGKVSSRDYDMTNFQDRDGNTALHIAASKTQPQMIKILLDCGLDVKKINTSGFTALDILDQNQTQSPNRETSLHILRTAKGRISSNSFSLHEMLRSTITLAEEQALNFKNMSPDKISALLVVLTIILAASYQALISPPGGVWQGDPTTNSTSIEYVGTSIMDRSSFDVFFVLNNLVFIFTSFLTIALLQIVCSSNGLIIMVELLLASLFGCLRVAWSVISPVDPTNFQVRKDVGVGLIPPIIYGILILFAMEMGRRIPFACMPPWPRFFTRLFREM